MSPKTNFQQPQQVQNTEINPHILYAYSYDNSGFYPLLQIHHKRVSERSGAAAAFVTCGGSDRGAAGGRLWAGPGPRSSTVVCRKTCTAWRRLLQQLYRSPRKEGHRSEPEAVIGLTVTTCMIMKHEPPGGEVSGTGRRRRHVSEMIPGSARFIGTVSGCNGCVCPVIAKINSFHLITQKHSI